MSEKEKLEAELQKVWNDLETFRRVELEVVKEKEQRMMSEVNNLRHNIKIIERRQERLKEVEVIKRISKDGFKSVKQLVIEGKGKVSDFDYFTHTGKDVTIYIRYEKAPNHKIGTYDFSELKRAFDKGLRIGAWYGPENSINVTYVKTGKTFARQMDKIFAKPKQKIEPEQTQ